MKSKRVYTKPYSQQRITELEAAIVELRRRQEAQPRNAVDRRATLAVLIAAFERRLSLTSAGMAEAELSAKHRQNTGKTKGVLD